MAITILLRRTIELLILLASLVIETQSSGDLPTIPSILNTGMLSINVLYIVADLAASTPNSKLYSYVYS